MIWRCDASEQETSARGSKRLSLFQDVRWLRPVVGGGRNAAPKMPRGMVEEVDPTLMFVPNTRRFAALAMFLAAVGGLVSSATAQRSTNSALEQRNLRQRIGANAVPLKRFPGLGDARFIPSDVTRRVFKSGKTRLQRDKKTGAVTRVQVGGTNGVNVTEQVVDLTPTPTADQLHPFWTADEQYLMYAGKPAASPADGYQLFRVAAGAVNNGTLPGNGISSPMTNQPGQDHLYPVVDGGGVRVAYAKGAAGSGNSQLYVALVPAVNQTIDIGPGGASNVLAITEGRTFEGRAFLKVGRPAWAGSLEIIFPAVMQGDTAYHLFKVNLLSFQFTRLTNGPASEENPSISPDGRTLAFDSNATPSVNGTSYSGNPAVAAGTAATRNVFLIPTNGGAVQQFTNRYAGTPAVNNVQPVWSGTRQNPYTNAAGANLWLAFASDRIINGGGFGVGSTGQKDIYTVKISDDRGNTLLSENSSALAVKLDSSDPGNIYDDEYPTWSPLINLVKVGFQSDRTGGLRTNNFGEGFTGTPSQNDIYVASLLDLNAPSLIRYNTNSVTGEIVHINLGSTYNSSQSVRTREDGLVPGGTAFFSVRIEDREAGLRADNDAAGGAAYIQFKNPNSLFQSQTQGSSSPREHKEFTSILDGGGPSTINEPTPGGGFQPLIFGRIPEGIPAISSTFPQDIRGTEYEAQVVDRSGNYHSHFFSENFGPIYEAGSSDSIAFSGIDNPPIDAAHGQPDCWIKLSRLPDQPADGQGGVLYGASVVLPTDPSDWYVDVILYDGAVNPFDTAQQSNWIIYDNIWGFSTAVGFNPREQDVLFVSDYTLGQKFYNSRFGGDAASPGSSGDRNFRNNNFGAESYYTDPDPSRYPGERGPNPGADSFFGAKAPAPPGTAGPDEPNPPRRWSAFGPFEVFPQLGTSPQGFSRLDFSGLVANPSVPNALGVGSYTDETIDVEPSLPGEHNGVRYALPVTGRYSIWRTLSRGPVPDIVLDSYLPRKTIAPADVATGETTPRNVTVVNRLVVWGSPFSGLSFVGPGTITDLTTQQRLARYVQNGGRLFMSGHDIGFALSGNGAQSNTFYTGTLNAQFQRDYTGGTFSAQPPGIGTIRVSQITRDPFIRADGTFGAQRAYGGRTGATAPYNPPSSGTLRISKRFPLTGEVANAQADGAATSDPSFSYIDESTLGSLTGGRTGAEFSYGGSQLIRTDFTGGGTTVFFPIGFESIGNEWYTYTPPGTGQPPLIANRGRRAEIMGNVTGSLRTATISGKLIDEQGSAVAGALVRAVRGGDNPAQVASGTAITDGGGNFTIVGLDADLYFVYGYSPGFYTQQVQFTVTQGGAIARLNLRLKRAAPGKLTSIPVTPGVRNGGVTDNAGNGLAGIEVQLRRLNPDGKLVAFNAITQPSTPITPAGAYTFPDLLIGEYEIFVNWPKTLDEAGNEIDNPLYNNIYGSLHLTSNPQDGVTLGPGAVIVPATSGTGVRLRIQEGVVSQIDFKLQGGSQRMTGRVLDAANNQPIAGADVAALDDAGTVVATATTGTDGRYNLQTVTTPPSLDIPAGNYRVTATARGYNTVTQTVTIGGTGTVVVPDHLLTKVPGGGVRGLISKATGGPLEGVTVKLFFVKPDGTAEATPTAQATSGAVAQTDNTGFVYNFDFPVPSVPIGDYIVVYEKDGLVSNPLQVRITVTSNNITRITNAVRMESPRVYGSGIQLLSVPFDYSIIPGFGAEQPYTIFSLGADKDNNGDGVVNATDAAIFSQFNVADWTGVDYRKGNNIPIVPGKGYFVRFGEVASVARTGNAVATSTFTLNLAAGWNLIGHPFANATNPSQPAPDLDINADVQVQDGTAAPISMAQAVRDGLVKSSVFGYTGSENGGQYIQTTTIKPWLGYWFRNSTTRALKLIFTYPATRAVAQRPAKTLTRAEAEMVTQRQIISRDNTDWRLQLAARQGNLLDTDNTVGVARDARDGYDHAYDNEKPPVLSQIPSINLGIDGTDGNGRAASFADQIRAPGGKKSWDVSVVAPRDGEVTLYWPSINRLPRGIQPVLVDVATGRRTSLRSAASYRFNATQGTTRKFRVEVGPARTAPLAIIGTRVANVGGTRGANAGYRFTFTATQEADVQVEIQTLTGRSLRKLETRATAGGESGVFWDGRTNQGAALPAGPYVVTISARDSEGVVVRASLPLTKVR